MNFHSIFKDLDMMFIKNVLHKFVNLCQKMPKFISYETELKIKKTNTVHSGAVSSFFAHFSISSKLVAPAGFWLAMVLGLRA